jgi:hypothetical protein
VKVPSFDDSGIDVGSFCADTELKDKVKKPRIIIIFPIKEIARFPPICKFKIPSLEVAREYNINYTVKNAKTKICCPTLIFT